MMKWYKKQWPNEMKLLTHAKVEKYRRYVEQTPPKAGGFIKTVIQHGTDGEQISRGQK